MFEAGASSGLMAALFTGGIALPHLAASGNADLVDRFVRPTLAGEKIGALAITEPGGGSDVASIRTTARKRRRPLRRRRHQDVHHQRRARRLRDRRPCAPAARAHGGISLLVVEKGTPGFTVDRSLAKMGWHCSDTAELGFAGVRVPAANLVGAGGCRLRPDRRAVRGRADRARRARLRHRRPVAGPHGGVRAGARDLRPARSSTNQVVRHRLVEMHRQVEVARTYVREVAAPPRRRRGRRRRGLPGQADRRRDGGRRLRRGGPAARRHRLPARHRGRAALPRRPHPAHRRRRHRGAHRPGRATAGVRS